MDANQKAKKAEYHILAKQYVTAFNLYQEIGDKDGMENVILYLIQEARLQLQRNGVACAGFDPQRELERLLYSNQAAFVADTYAKYLAGDKNPSLLYRLAYYAPDGSKVITAAVTRLMEELKTDKSTSKEMPYRIGDYHWTKIGLLLAFCKKGGTPENLESIRPIFLSRKIGPARCYEYARLINDTELAVRSLKKSYWRLRSKNPHTYFFYLAELGCREEIYALARWFEKKPRRIVDNMENMGAYLEAKDYLKEKYDDFALARLCIKHIKKATSALYALRKNKTGISHACKMEIARAYELAGDFLSAIEIYMELNSRRMDGHIARICLSNDKKTENKKKQLFYTLNSETVKNLPDDILSILLNTILAIDPTRCARWVNEGLQISKEQLQSLAQTLLDSGYVYEDIFLKAGIPVTVETYQKALVNLKCDPQEAERSLEKIFELMQLPKK